MSNSKFLERISAQLIEFSDSLAPSDEYKKMGRKLVEEVYETLKGVHKSGTLSRFKVDREFYGGSVGKNTSVIYPDFDCVVFLNDVEPPLTPFLKEFEIILRRNAQNLSIIPESIKLKWLTVSACFENGVEMDLLAACNFSQDPDEQHRLVLDHIKSKPSDCLLYSSSLAALQIDFIRSQSGLTHQLIRLAKYWYKSLSLDENVYGGSAIMEIICVTVIAESSPPISMLDVFKKFLQKVVEMKTLKIAFIMVQVILNGKYKDEWKLVKDRYIMQFTNHFDYNIITRPNYIIEPANPYNDMAQNISDAVFKKLSKFANEMIKRLEYSQIHDILTFNGQMLTSIDISKLFEPFPLCLSDEYSPYNLPTEALVDYQYAYCINNSAEPQFIPNNSAFDEDKRKVTKVFLNNLAFLIRAPRKKEIDNKKYVLYTDGVARVSLDEVKLAVKRLISVNFGPGCVKESKLYSEHSDYDVTIYAPYNCGMCVCGCWDNKYAVRLSLKWPSSSYCVIM